MPSSLPHPTDCCSDDPCGDCEDNLVVGDGSGSGDDAESVLGFYIRRTVPELRLVPHTANLKYAVVFGNLVAGDAQPRRYWWNAAELGADDGISIVRPSSQAPGAVGAWNEL